MKELLQRADETPATFLIALAAVTMAFLTDPFAPSSVALSSHGWLLPLLVSEGEPWRLLTHAFLHGGILHLAMNLMALLWVAPMLERMLGSVRFLSLYLLSALGGGIAVCLLYDPLDPVVGGSGALFGLFGALVACNMRAGRHLFSFLEFHGPRQLLSLILVNLAIGFLLPVVSNTAHIGGLVAGFAVQFVFLDPGRTPTRERRPLQLAVAALFLSTAMASIWPVTRWDWLWNRSAEATTVERRIALQRAAAMDYFGLRAATAADVMALQARLFPDRGSNTRPTLTGEPPADEPGERRR